VMARTYATAQLMASVFAGSAFREGDYRLVMSRIGEPLFDDTVAPDSRSGIQPFETHKYIWAETKRRAHESLQRLVQLAPVAELVAAFRLPVASAFSPLCIRRNTDPAYEPGDRVLTLGFDEQGVKGNPHPKPVRLPLGFLTKHVAVFGLPGAGKTTKNNETLFQLYQHRIPFIVIETAKTEYRAIKNHKNHKNKRYRELARRLEVYAAADDGCCPLRFNPL